MRRLGIALLVVVVAVALLPPLLAPGPDRRALPEAGRPVAVAPGIELAVTELGSGPPVILVHGLPSSAADWGQVPEQLAALGDHVVVYDRAGFGFSSRPADTPGSYTLASSARDLRGLLDALGIQRAALVGWSYGGGVVQVLAQQAPERVSALVLLGSVGPYYVESKDEPIAFRLVASPLGLPLLRWVSAIPPLSRAMTHQALVDAFSDGSRIPPGWEARTTAMLAMPGTLRSYVLETQRMDVTALHPDELHVPTLVLQGDADRLVSKAVAQDLARRIPGAKLTLVPGGSHMLPATHPDLVARDIYDFVLAH
jgi:pimeloyl-ACP methyl ester carboxylesterase